MTHNASAEANDRNDCRQKVENILLKHFKDAKYTDYFLETENFTNPKDVDKSKAVTAIQILLLALTSAEWFLTKRKKTIEKAKIPEVKKEKN